MKTLFEGRTYTVLTWDCELQKYTPQVGLSVPCVDVPLATLRQAMRELRRKCGYGAYRVRGRDGRYDCNDAAVSVERTDQPQARRT